MLRNYQLSQTAIGAAKVLRRERTLGDITKELSDVETTTRGRRERDFLTRGLRVEHPETHSVILGVVARHLVVTAAAIEGPPNAICSKPPGRGTVVGPVNNGLITAPYSLQIHSPSLHIAMFQLPTTHSASATLTILSWRRSS